jgi:hypothetical protein
MVRVEQRLWISLALYLFDCLFVRKGNEVVEGEVDVEIEPSPAGAVSEDARRKRRGKDRESIIINTNI